MAKRLKVLAIKSGLRCQLTGGVGTLQVYETKCQDSLDQSSDNNKDVKSKLKAMILIYPETQSPLSIGNIKQTLLLIGFKGELSILTYFPSS